MKYTLYTIRVGSDDTYLYEVPANIFTMRAPNIECWVNILGSYVGEYVQYDRETKKLWWKNWFGGKIGSVTVDSENWTFES